MDGKYVKLARLFGRETSRAGIVAFDHGATSGPVSGIRPAEFKYLSECANRCGAVLSRPAMLERINPMLNADVFRIVHLTGRVLEGVSHYKFSSVQSALRSGADAVCVEMKLGESGERRNIEVACSLVEEAHLFGLPVLVTVYPAAGYIETAGDFAYEHGVRLAWEIGADFIKSSLPESPAAIRKCVEGVDVPLLVAGGDRPALPVVKGVRNGMLGGASGWAVGRAIWGVEGENDTFELLIGLLRNQLS